MDDVFDDMPTDASDEEIEARVAVLINVITRLEELEISNRNIPSIMSALSPGQAQLKINVNKLLARISKDPYYHNISGAHSID